MSNLSSQTKPNQRCNNSKTGDSMTKAKSRNVESRKTRIWCKTNNAKKIRRFILPSDGFATLLKSDYLKMFCYHDYSSNGSCKPTLSLFRFGDTFFQLSLIIWTSNKCISCKNFWFAKKSSFKIELPCYFVEKLAQLILKNCIDTVGSNARFRHFIWSFIGSCKWEERTDKVAKLVRRISHLQFLGRLQLWKSSLLHVALLHHLRKLST